MGTWHPTDGMLSLHTVRGHEYAVRGYESSADEFAIERLERTRGGGETWTPVLHFVVTLSGWEQVFYTLDTQDPEEVMRAMCAMCERYIMLTTEDA